MLCPKCRLELPAGVRFCPRCGEPVPSPQNAQGYTAAASVDPRDFDQRNSRAFGLLCYLGPVFYLLVLLLADPRKDDAVRFHINQALAFYIVSILLLFIPLIGWLAEIVLFAFWIYAFVCACQGKCKPAPAVGAIHIIR